MKRLNKKGITLVELIVSFALVAVAVTYFYQTLTTVHKLYKISREETNDFVDKTYALRIADACLNDAACVITSDLSSYNLKYTYDSTDTSCDNGIGLYKFEYGSTGGEINLYCLNQ